MKQKEITILTDDELNDKLGAFQKNLHDMKLTHAVSPLENPLQIRNMTIDELNEKLTDTSKKLSQLKFNNSVQTIENPLEIKILRRQIAKLKTILNEKKQD